MKKVLFGLTAILLFAFHVNAQKENVINQKVEFKSGSIITSSDKENIEYKFGSIEDLNEGVNKIIADLYTTKSDIKRKDDELKVQVKLEMSVGTITLAMSETFIDNGSNKPTNEVIERLKAVLIAMID